jgi:hypothetical protein
MIAGYGLIRTAYQAFHRFSMTLQAISPRLHPTRVAQRFRFD